MLTNYHTHTTWSDGEAGAAEMAAAARDAGLAEVGISDHYVLTPDHRRLCWSMPLDGLEAYTAAVARLQAETADFPLRLGLETDYFPETIDELAPLLARYPFDYIIGSVHIVDGFLIDENAESWAVLTQDERNEQWRRYWVRLREMAACGLFDIAGHLDLPKKYGCYPTVDFSVEIADVLEAMADTGMSIELNTAGWHKPACEAYPALAILLQARRRDIPLLITADAHAPEQIARDFEHAAALAREAGYRGQVRYRQRERYAVEGW